MRLNGMGGIWVAKKRWRDKCWSNSDTWQRTLLLSQQIHIYTSSNQLQRHKYFDKYHLRTVKLCSPFNKSKNLFVFSAKIFFLNPRFFVVTDKTIVFVDSWVSWCWIRTCPSSSSRASSWTWSQWSAETDVSGPPVRWCQPRPLRSRPLRRKQWQFKKRERFRVCNFMCVRVSGSQLTVIEGVQSLVLGELDSGVVSRQFPLNLDVELLRATHRHTVHIVNDQWLPVVRQVFSTFASVISPWLMSIYKTHNVPEGLPVFGLVYWQHSNIFIKYNIYQTLSGIWG